MSILKTFSIFAKFWEKGKVKTRLAQSVGEIEAANVYLQFLKVSLQIAAQWSGRRVIGFSPENREKEFRELAPDWELIPQVSSFAGKTAGLGIRMKQFFDTLFDETEKREEQEHRVVLIGSDTPLLNSEIIEQAFERLADNDVVIGPSFDGGYYLIGARNNTPDIFDQIRWSSNQVLEQTIDQLRSKNYKFSLLDPHGDVDDVADLRQMVDKLNKRKQRNVDLDILLQLSQIALANVPADQTESEASIDSPNSIEREES